MKPQNSSMTVTLAELYVREALSTIRRIRDQIDREAQEGGGGGSAGGSAAELKPHHISALEEPMWRLTDAAGWVSEQVPDAMGARGPTYRGFRVVRETK